ncbi:hypothetical protein D3C86_1453060 [compost metagenome]
METSPDRITTNNTFVIAVVSDGGVDGDVFRVPQQVAVDQVSAKGPVVADLAFVAEDPLVFSRRFQVLADGRNRVDGRAVAQHGAAWDARSADTASGTSGPRRIGDLSAPRDRHAIGVIRRGRTVGLEILAEEELGPGLTEGCIGGYGQIITAIRTKDAAPAII